VIHSKTRWNGARLITTWNTSELLGVSFERPVGPFPCPQNGRALTLEIHANSSQDGTRTQC